MKIFYFTGTGNSLSTARKLAAYFPGCKVVALVSLSNEDSITVDDDVVGFVYPIYGGDLPLFVRKTLMRMNFIGRPYIFAVTTSGGNPTPSEVHLAKLLHEKGQVLSFQRDVYLPGNMRIPKERDAKAELQFQDTAVMLAAERIQERKFVPYNTEAQLAVSRYSAGYANLVGMTALETCIGCGICVRLCPMNNIKIVDRRAFFGENCTVCAACFHWCPQHAIYMSKSSNPTSAHRPQYHHPNVTLEDMLAQKN